MERPVIATKLAGPSSAVLDGVTGILIDSPHVAFLEKALKKLIEDPSKRGKMGQAGRRWVKEDFAKDIYL